MLDVGIDVGQYLARVVFVGQAIDHRDTRIGGEALNNLLLEGADHDDVRHARNHLCCVFDRFATTQLRVARIQINGGPAELVHTSFKRQAGARRGFLKNHHQSTIGQRPIALVSLKFTLDPARTREHMLKLVAAELVELQEMFNRHA